MSDPAKKQQTWPQMLTWIILAGLALRILWALAVEMVPVSDSQAYHTFAQTIALHGVYGFTPDEPGAFWPVGTAAITALLYMMFGVSFLPVIVFNIFVGTALIPLMFYAGCMFATPAAGLVSAVIIALWPSLIMFSTVIASEPTFMLLTLAGLLAYRRDWQRPWVGVVLAGVLWAGACYVRPLALLFPIVFGAAFLLRKEWSIIRTALCMAATLAVMAALIAPWSMRNQALFNDFVLISTNFGPVFWMGNNPETTGGFQLFPEWAEDLPEAERAEQLKQAAIDYIKADPGAFVRRVVEKFVVLHSHETIAIAWNQTSLRDRFGAGAAPPLKIMASAYWIAVLAAAIAGLVLMARQQGLWSMLTHPAFLGWMYFAWVHAIIITGDRYHLPAIPFVAILAATALVQLSLSQQNRVGAR